MFLSEDSLSSLVGCFDTPLCLHSALYVFAVIPELCENKNGGCEHFCHVVQGNIRCSCADGYFLASDDKSCNSNGERDSKVYMVHAVQTL